MSDDTRGGRLDVQAGTDVSRRDVLRLTAGAVVAARLPAIRAAAAEPDLRFFTRDEYALADTLCELVIPADAHSPGARAAGAAAYIDQRLAEAFTDEPRTVWREGLRLVDAAARRTHGQPFAALPHSEQTAILETLAAGEASPATDEQRFFVVLKQETIQAYYTSKIGIHDDIGYKGNTLLQEFAGVDVSRER